jgi:hypothetical protein
MGQGRFDCLAIGLQLIAYARGSFWKERVAMAQWWADHLDTLKRGRTVVPMRRSA